MNKSAVENFREIIFSSIIDAITASRKASGGVPNNMLRELNSLHDNTAFDTLPPHLTNAINESAANALQKLRSQGYVVAPKDSVFNGPKPSPKRAPNRF